MNALLIASLLASGVMPTPAASEPLAPTGKWTIEYDPNMCVLAHDYGAGDTKITLAFRPWPMGDETEIVMLRDGDGRGPTIHKGKGQVMIAPSGQSASADYYRYNIAKTKKQIVTLNARQNALSAIEGAATISLAVDAAPATVFALPNFAAANKALSACEDDLLKGWGIDPSERLLIAEGGAGAKGDPAQWITSDDYPVSLLDRNASGTSTIVWAIDEKGSVKDCRVVNSSGYKEFDEVACRAITQRAHYTPAHDKTGKPVLSHSTRRVVWNPPGG